MTEIDMQKAIAQANDFVANRVKNVKTARLGLDQMLQLLHRLNVEETSEETVLSIQRVREGVMWLGMELKRLGQLNPYPNSYNPESPVVDPTADGLKL
jgi:hypothetical protein